ncbi:hypothetical protein Taro_003844 [Colocasia esculenta]|uniref:Uncharacterized protein n=1 Tax=Colocasia esculenta TaxID=4460 RepID=A0A843TT28_COLES|nr:hypothetical protein [Colocasia esculenta]
MVLDSGDHLNQLQEMKTGRFPCNSLRQLSMGFSLVPVHHKDKVFLVAFGGSKKEPSNQVEILIMVKDEHSMNWQSGQDSESTLFKKRTTGRVGLAVHLKNDGPVDSIAKHSITSIVEHHNSGRKSLSETSSEPNSVSGSVPLRKQFHHEEEYNSAQRLQKSHEDDKHTDGGDYTQKSKNQEATVKPDMAGRTGLEVTVLTESDNSNEHQKQGNRDVLEGEDISPTGIERKSMISGASNLCMLYETKIAALMRKNVLLEGQLASAVTGRDSAEKNLSCANKSREDSENKLAETVKEVELLKEKLACMEVAQEETNSLSNIVHSDNVRLEHDVAFLKAVLDDTQKELQSTRGVLAAERARAFQLQYATSLCPPLSPTSLSSLSRSALKRMSEPEGLGHHHMVRRTSDASTMFVSTPRCGTRCRTHL